jgi:hypothetical protein
LHKVVPEPHAHELETQVAPDVQALPQAPQLFESEVVSMHAVEPGHWTSLPEHPQTPFEQTSPVAHGWLHPPQFAALLVVSTHAEPQGV